MSGTVFTTTEHDVDEDGPGPTGTATFTLRTAATDD